VNRRKMIAFLRNDLEVPMSSVRRLALAAIRIDQRNVCSHAPRRHGAYRRRKHVRPSACCIGFDVMADTLFKDEHTEDGFALHSDYRLRHNGCEKIQLPRQLIG